MKVTVTGQVQKLCPYRSEVDHGTVSIIFEIAEGDGPELHGLARHLGSFAGVPMSHEEFTRVLASDFDAIAVHTTWQTAGLEVHVEVSNRRV